MALPIFSASNLDLPAHRTTRPYMHRGEQEVLIALIARIAPRTMVEIGVNIGLTAQAVLREVPTIERYYGVDVDAGYKFEIPAQQTEYPGDPGRLVNGDPRFQLVLRGEEMPTEADVVFIDGDHGHKAVLADSIWAANAVNPGGIIIWHDYQNPTVEVTGVLDMLESAGRSLYHVDGTWLAFEIR